MLALVAESYRQEKKKNNRYENDVEARFRCSVFMICGLFPIVYYL